MDQENFKKATASYNPDIYNYDDENDNSFGRYFRTYIVALRQNEDLLKHWKNGRTENNIKVVGYSWVHRDEDSREEKYGTRMEQSDWSSQNGAGSTL